MTMGEVAERLAHEYSWSASVPNLPDKLKHGSFHYDEAVELAEVMGYELVQRK